MFWISRTLDRLRESASGKGRTGLGTIDSSPPGPIFVGGMPNAFFRIMQIGLATLFFGLVLLIATVPNDSNISRDNRCTSWWSSRGPTTQGTRSSSSVAKGRLCWICHAQRESAHASVVITMVLFIRVPRIVSRCSQRLLVAIKGAATRYSTVA